jgi:putative addiction module component (TIGR02574 family)
MNDTARTLLRDALALPDEERASLVAELLASLEGAPTDDPAEVGRSWAHEIERRARRVLAGETSTVDWHQVRERLARGVTDR